jgi:leucyl aminopeptidase
MATATSKKPTRRALAQSRNGFNPVPSATVVADAQISVGGAATGRATAMGVPVAASGSVPREVGLDRKALAAAGFDGKVGQALAIPQRGGKATVAVGIGEPNELDAAKLRNAAAAFARAAGTHTRLATSLADVAAVDAQTAAQAVVEGALLARYKYRGFKVGSEPIAALALVVASSRSSGAQAGAERARLTAGAAKFSRDLANTPHNHLTASGMARVATAIGKETGLKVEIFDKRALERMGCGGMLGVNAGSAEPPALIKLTYTPRSAGKDAPRLTLVGKGIMYDSGGIALKPGDDVHAQMKNDMTGAGSILSAMATLRDLGCTSHVTGYLCCTDNMPSGTAMALGDVITMRGGKTVEVNNTDAEGRLVMADALALATEEPVDAIVDIATLTGACMRALGRARAGVLGNNQSLVDQVLAAADATDERAWQFPLEREYRPWLDSNIADMKNLGGALAGQTTAALFLEEFVAGNPWAHIDIAGTAWADADSGWLTTGCTGAGARLLIELALNFTKPPK